MNLSTDSSDTETSITTDNEQTSQVDKPLKLVTINVNSIHSSVKRGLFHAFIEQEKPDIMLVNETEADNSITDNELLPAGYSSIRDLKQGDKHGVLIAYKSDFIISEVPLVNRQGELVLAKLQIVGKPALYIGSFYRRTNANPSDLLALQDNLNSIMTGNKLPNLVLAGDFNLPSIDWQTEFITPKPQYGLEVNQLCIDICNNFYLTQTVTEPTRYDNTLDLIFTTNPDLVNNVKVIPGVSDHKSPTADVSLKAKTNVKKPRTVFMYNKMNKEAMEKDIKEFKDDFIRNSSKNNTERN